MRVKTNVAGLIRRLQDQKARELHAYREAMEAYPELEAKYRDKLLAALERELERVAGGGRLPESYSYYRRDRYVDGVIVPVAAKKPAVPQRPSFSTVNKRIAELRLCSQEDIVIDPSGSEWRGLLRGAGV